MKATELMVGNWVLINGTPRKIQAVDGVDDEIMADDELYTLAEDRYHSEDKVDGVPITPEILEKNGFRKLVTYGTEKWLCNNLRLNVYSSDGTWRFCADTNRNENSVIYIRFVHELQNALSLCGIKHDIKL